MIRTCSLRVFVGDFLCYNKYLKAFAKTLSGMLFHMDVKAGLFVRKEKYVEMWIWRRAGSNGNQI